MELFNWSWGEVIFEHALPTWAIALAVGLTLLVTIGAFLRYLPISVANLVLFILRAAFLLLLGWCMLLPIMRRTLTEYIKPHFLVVLDTSASMTMKPVGGAISNRWQVAQGVLAQPWPKRLMADCTVDLFTLDAEPGAVTPIGQYAQFSPKGQASHLRAGLRKIFDRYKGQNVAGLLFLSDGLDTREIHEDWVLGPWPCPVYTVRLEPPDIWEAEVDVRIDSVDTPRRAIVGWETKLTAVLSGQGVKGETFAVQLLEDGALVEEIPTELPPDGGTREVSFRLKHPVVGNFTYTVNIPPLKKETRTNDNAYAVSVQVVDAKNRLLYVENVPRWESKYLIRELRANKNISPLAFVRGPNKLFLTFGERGSMNLDLTEEQLNQYKILIVGDLDAEVLGAARAGALLKWVEVGGSMVLLGGPGAWGENGFAATALKKMLPVQRPWESPPREGTFAAAVTPDGSAHPIFTAGTNDWKTMPPVLSLFTGARLSAGATTLVEAQTPQGAQPVIVVQKYGQGKVAAILTDSLWRWQLNPGEIQPYAKFWAQLIDWLLPTEVELEKFELDLFSDTDQLFMGEAIALKARLSAGEIAVPANTRPVCEVRGPGERRIPLDMTRQTVAGGAAKNYHLYAVEFTPGLAGLHKAVATIEINGQRVDSAPYTFFIKGFTPETNPRPFNAELLKRMAEIGKGKFLEPAQVNEELSALRFKKREEQRLEFRSLWQNWVIVACLMLLLAVEWTIRKLRNMA